MKKRNGFDIYDIILLCVSMLLIYLFVTWVVNFSDLGEQINPETNSETQQEVSYETSLKSDSILA